MTCRQILPCWCSRDRKSYAISDIGRVKKKRLGYAVELRLKVNLKFKKSDKKRRDRGGDVSDIFGSFIRFSLVNGRAKVDVCFVEKNEAVT